jgi:hypothetical protein
MMSIARDISVREVNAHGSGRDAQLLVFWMVTHITSVQSLEVGAHLCSSHGAPPESAALARRVRSVHP